MGTSDKINELIDNLHQTFLGAHVIDLLPQIVVRVPEAS
jgi:hypothetical protein